jgi:hypothetical protein
LRNDLQTNGLRRKDDSIKPYARIQNNKTRFLMGFSKPVCFPALAGYFLLQAQ